MAKKINRRDFLKIFGGASVGVDDACESQHG